MVHKLFIGFQGWINRAEAAEQEKDKPDGSLQIRNWVNEALKLYLETVFQCLGTSYGGFGVRKEGWLIFVTFCSQERRYASGTVIECLRAIVNKSLALGLTPGDEAQEILGNLVPTV